MINVRIQTPEVQKLSPKITVVGIGGAGGNAVNNMISSALEGCEFLVCNTDSQALDGSLCDNKLQLGAHVTGGLGAGAKPEVGEKSAHESLDEVMQYLEGSNMVFITAGMGGGTGTGAAPVIAKACRDNGILTVGVVTKPFHFEGTHRMKQAEAGIEEMQGYVDTLIVIPNQNLFRIANEKTTFAEAFKMADGVLQSGVRGVTDLMVMPGLINLDFADIRSAMLEMGKAMMGTGESEGDRRATEAAESAINNPLLDDVSMKGARGVIINVTGGHDMTLFEVDEACNRIRDEVDPNANIIFGSTFDEKLDGKMRVSVVATGIDAIQSARTGGGTGGVRVTAVGKPAETATAPKVEATVSDQRPQTEVARAMTLNARKETVAKPAVQAVASTLSAAPKTDMFASQEYHAAAPSPSSTSSATSMRGSVHQGHFIPPSPVVPAPQDEVAYAPAAQVQQQVAAQQQAVSTPAPMTAQRPAAYEETSTPQAQTLSQGLVLRPPVPGVNTTSERRKTPSLFERITGAYEAYKGDHADEGESSSSSGSQQGAGGFHGGRMGNTAAAEAPSQGKLNIESPAAPKANEDDLDIPAFLRRQAN
jgi:cell division protein FtsZ